MDKIITWLDDYEKVIASFKITLNTYIIDIIKSNWLPTDRLDIFGVDDLDKIVITSNYYKETEALTINISQFLVFIHGIDNAYFCTSAWIEINTNITITEYYALRISSSITDLTEEDRTKLNTIGTLIHRCINNIDEEYKNVLFNFYY